MNPKEFRIKQDIFRQIQGYKTIFKYLQEGVIIFDILEEIAKDKEKASEVYRLDIFDILCKFFSQCHQILMSFCDGNVENQKIMAENMSQLMENRHINFNQIELLRRVCQKDPNMQMLNDRNEKIYAAKSLLINQMTSPLLDFLFDLVRYHGKIPEIVEFFIDLVKANEQNSLFFKRSLLKKLFSSAYMNDFRVHRKFTSDSILLY